MSLSGKFKKSAKNFKGDPLQAEVDFLQECLDNMTPEEVLRGQCDTAYECICDGTFTRKEALNAYGVTEKEYSNYLKEKKQAAKKTRGGPKA